jgi:hypothetical protein
MQLRCAVCLADTPPVLCQLHLSPPGLLLSQHLRLLRRGQDPVQNHPLDMLEAVRLKGAVPVGGGFDRPQP